MLGFLCLCLCLCLSWKKGAETGNPFYSMSTTQLPHIETTDNDFVANILG